MNTRVYSENLGNDIGHVRQAVIRKLKSVDSQVDKKETWNLRSVAIGLGVSVTAGLGPIVSVGARAKTRLVFSNSSDPVYP